jgi:hypothetical protein
MLIAGRGIEGIGLGTAQFAFRDGTAEDSVATVHAALDAGVMLIDTALANGCSCARLKIARLVMIIFVSVSMFEHASDQVRTWPAALAPPLGQARPATRDPGHQTMRASSPDSCINRTQRVSSRTRRRKLHTLHHPSSEDTRLVDTPE